MTAYDLRLAARTWERIAQSATDKPDMPPDVQVELRLAARHIYRAVQHLAKAADRLDAK